MPKYLVHANYVGNGITALIKDGGTGRRKAIEQLAASYGGTVEMVYYALGDTDLFVVVDLPDNESAAGLSLTAASTGAVTLRMTALLSPEQVDDAARKASAASAPTFD